MASIQQKENRPDWRFFILPTRERVLNLLAKIEDTFPSSEFWFTDEASYRENILGKIWWTPKDFRDKTYSIFKPPEGEQIQIV